MSWSNAPLKVYHGTNKRAADNIFNTEPDPFMGRTVADFGQGFYVTTSLNQANNWANVKVKSIPPGAHSDSYVAAVVSFDMDRDIAGSFRDHLVFILANAEFHEFVLFNRFGSTRHGRSSHLEAYDIVYGPVAAYPQTLTFADCDQICFVAKGGSSRGRAIDALSNKSVNYGIPLFP